MKFFSKKKKEENLINNGEMKERYANYAINSLMGNRLIVDFNNIECEYGYLYNIDGHGLEGLFKIKKDGRIFYFAIQGDRMQMLNLNEQQYDAYTQSFIAMHN